MGMRTFTFSRLLPLMSRTKTRNHMNTNRRTAREAGCSAIARIWSTSFRRPATERSRPTTSRTRVAMGAGRRSLVTRAA